MLTSEHRLPSCQFITPHLMVICLIFLPVRCRLRSAASITVRDGAATLTHSILRFKLLAHLYLRRLTGEPRCLVHLRGCGTLTARLNFWVSIALNLRCRARAPVRISSSSVSTSQPTAHTITTRRSQSISTLAAARSQVYRSTALRGSYTEAFHAPTLREMSPAGQQAFPLVVDPFSSHTRGRERIAGNPFLTRNCL